MDAADTDDRTNPLAPHRIERAREIMAARGAALLRAAGGDVIQAKRDVWQASRTDQALRIALARVLTAEGAVLISAPGKALDKAQWDGVPAAQPFLGRSTVTDPADPEGFADPLSYHRVRAAEETFALAVLRAELRVGSADPEDFLRARRLLWAWAKQDAELHDALVRLAIVGRQPAAIVMVPASWMADFEAGNSPCDITDTVAPAAQPALLH